MTVGELRDKITEAGGKLVVGPLELSYKEDKEDNEDIDIRSQQGGLLAWVRGSESRESDVVKEITIDATSALKNATAVVALSQFLGLEVVGYQPIEVAKEVQVIKEVESKDTHELRGMVRAYETILVGRQLSVGPQLPEQIIIGERALG